jgi:hypothetical protein
MRRRNYAIVSGNVKNTYQINAGLVKDNMIDLGQKG